jgi:predicted transposase YbfD/YdcC
MTAVVPPLAATFATIPEYRHARGQRHPLTALLLLSCVAMLGGARGPSGIAEWAKNHGEPWRTRLGFTHHRGPSQSTVQRLFAHIAIDCLEAHLASWAQQVIAALPPLDPAALEGVAMDGKALRMSARCGASDPHLLSLYSHRLGLVLAQVAVADKTNEIGASDAALAQLLLTGVVLTGDALLTQRAVAQQLLAQGNDDLLVVKENQPTLHADLVTLFVDPDATIHVAEQEDTHSQRSERRRLAASTELAGYSDWPGLAQALCIERHRMDMHTGKRSVERAYAVTSLPPERATPQQLLALWRAHWLIENRLHYVRDVTYGEDRATVRVGSSAQALAAMRNVAIGLLRLAGETNIAAACRRYAAQPDRALAAVGLT